MSELEFIRIQVDGDAKDALDAVCERRGTTQITTMSRLVRWFLRQDSVIQAAIMKTLSPDAISKLARQKLREMR